MFCFIVDGDMEKEFIEKLCSRKYRIRKIPNSKNLCAERMCDFIETHVRELADKNLTFIIWIDHEGKQISPVDFERIIRANIGEILGDDNRVAIGIADRMKENWMLADTGAVQDHYDPTYTYDPSTEGAGGKTIIKRLAERCGESYIERVDGVDLLMKCVPSAMALNSASARRFFNSLPEIDCWWLDADRAA